MPKTDEYVDQYIEKSADFAKPILLHLRKLVHEACPDVAETKKWSFPHFDYKGMLCSMASFKEHCSFGFWKQSLMEDRQLLKANREQGGMGSFGKITSLAELPSDEQIIGYIKEAMELNDAGVKLPPRPKPEKKELVIPQQLTLALENNEAANLNFEKFSYSHKKEYVQWIIEAKTEATRDKRIATAIEWLSEGKARNWKYENC